MKRYTRSSRSRRLAALAVLSLLPAITGCLPAIGGAIWTTAFVGELLTMPFRSLLGSLYLQILNNTVLIPGS